MFKVVNERTDAVVAQWGRNDDAETHAGELNANYPNGDGPYMVVPSEPDDSAAQCRGDADTCLCDAHVWARHDAARAPLSRRERWAVRGKLLGSDFAVAQSPGDSVTSNSVTR
jgi:hypothetical protein